MAWRLGSCSVFAPLPQVERGYATILSGNEAANCLVYTNGKCVVKRKLDNPYDCETVFLHNQNVGVARFSPCGQYIASGDAAGCVKVWAAQADSEGGRAMKNDIPVLGGQIKDLQWSPDGKKIVAVGEGRGNVAKCFAWDRGSNFGEFDGLSRKVNSCDFRPTDPLKIVTGSEDSSVNVYSGPPFKFQLSNKKHTNFVNCVRYSPDGSRFVSVSSDKKCILYHGDSGEVLQEFGTQEGHTGSIMSCSWSPDNSKIITAAADKTVKVWDMASGGKLSSTIKFGSGQVEDMQVGCCWVGSYVMSLSLSGHVNYLDLSSGKVRSQIMGHTKSISTMTQVSDGGEGFYTSSYDGKVCEWDASAGCKSTAFVHENMPVNMSLAGPGTFIHSIGLDDTFKITSLPLRGKDTSVKTVKLDAQPKGSSYCKATDTSAIAYEQKIELMKDGNVACKMDFSSSDASSCAISPNGQQVAVGFKSGKILTYEVKSGGSALAATGKTLERHRGEVTVMVYSSDGTMLASGDSNREVLVWDTATSEVKKSRMVYHNSKITCLSWSPDNTKLCSGSVDSNIIVWPLDLPTSKRTNLPLSHQEGVQGVAFLSDTKIASIGTDACCKIWTLQQ